MSWDQFCSSVKKFAKKTADQIDYSADLANLNVKLAMAEKKVTDTYTELGKAAYAHFSGEENGSDEVAKAMVQVNDAKRAVAELKLRIQKLKQDRAKAQEEAEEMAQGQKVAEEPKQTPPEAEEAEEPEQAE